jgi:hypothetical protein
VPEVVRAGIRAETSGVQQRAGFLETDAFLELQGAHGRDSAEVPVERGLLAVHGTTWRGVAHQHTNHLILIEGPEITVRPIAARLLTRDDAQ